MRNYRITFVTKKFRETQCSSVSRKKSFAKGIYAYACPQTRVHVYVTGDFAVFAKFAKVFCREIASGAATFHVCVYSGSACDIAKRVVYQRL